MIDAIIVGGGLSALAMSKELEARGLSYRVFDDGLQRSSMVAGGVYNPVILKRFTLAWKAGEQMRTSLSLYRSLEREWGVPLDMRVPVLRRLHSAEEQNGWFEAMDKPGLGEFMSGTLEHRKVEGIQAPYGYGRVRESGWIDTAVLLTTWKAKLKEKNLLHSLTFDYNTLKIHEEKVVYEKVEARRVIFCEGYALKMNPYFSWLPLTGTKGELLIIYCDGLHLDFILKSSVFMIPLGNDLYKVGATYAWQDKTQLPTAEGKSELLAKLDIFLKRPYEVKEHLAGIRPTVADRRPLVGDHPQFRRVSVINGLGSRGVLVAPYAAGALARYLYDKEDLDPVINIYRFTKRYQNAVKEGTTF